MVRRTLVLLMVAALLAACRLGPRFDNYPQPTLTVDQSPFEAAGCPVDRGNLRLCLPESPFGLMGCDAMRLVPDLLGGLEPGYPLALCDIYPGWHDEDSSHSQEALEESANYVFKHEGSTPVFVRYVIYRDGAFVLLANREALRDTYAPIESPEAALSYAMAATGLEARYGQERQTNHAYEGNRIADTHVTEVANGYRVILFDLYLFGCGPHWTYEVDLHVRTDGEITELGRRPVFRDKATDGVCID
jgi:hypothetical protein